MATSLKNSEVISYLGLPQTIIDGLQTAQGTSFTQLANEFITAIVNKIVYQKVDKANFTNPFKKYDGYPCEYGNTIENIFTELPKGYTFNKDATDPFVKVIPNVKTLYATVNYELQYELTIQDTLLRRAVMTEYGLMNLINTLLQTLVDAMSIDEYFATIAMLNNANIYANGFEDVEKGSTDKETAQIITKKIIDVCGSMKMPLKSNNKLKVMNTTSPENLLLIIKRERLDQINLDYLTGVFNLSKVDLIKNIIPVETFKVEDQDGTLKGDELDFIILDTRGFDNHVALQDGGMIYNPKGKYTNHFTNLWKIISFKYYMNARAFKMVEKPIA